MKRKKQNNPKSAPVAVRLQNLSRKTIAATVLVSLMVLLWGRVLLKGKGSPAEAVAQDVSPLQSPIAKSVASSAGIEPVVLDVLNGRHDALTCDMFSTANWKAFSLTKQENVSSNAQVLSIEENLEKRHQLNLEKMAKTLKLEAVIHNADGIPYQVFVNDAILTVGSVLTVKEGPDQYELSLKEIKENEALFAWNKFSITLKMTETVEK